MKKTLLIPLIISLWSCADMSVEERFNKISDSDRKELVEELEQMVERDQHLRTISANLNKNAPSYHHEMDSLWNIIDSIDAANTARLIEITETYGFPNVDRIDAPVPAWLIFHHSPEESSEELKVLLKEENESGRLPDMEYAMITWHLNGRKAAFPLGEITEEAE